MRRGKEIAQGAHASLAFLTNRIRKLHEGFLKIRFRLVCWLLELSEEEISWILSSFAKVTLQVKSEGELYLLSLQAKSAGLTAELIVDSGKTEFGGVPTPTAVAIGPHEAEKIDPITGKLELY